MKQHRAYLQSAGTWVNSHLDVGDVVAMVGVAIAYDGVTTVFGPGWARIGLGLLILSVYLLHELRPHSRGRQ